MISESSNSETISVLTDLGLSVLQSKIYLILLTQESVSAKVVSSISKVSRPDVYRIITQLEELRLIERIVGRPAHYQAVPIEMCTSILMQNQVKKLSEIKNRIPQLIHTLNKSKNKEQMEPKGQIIVINKESFYKRSINMINNAKESIFLVLPIDTAICPTAPFEKGIDAALSRNVDCRMISDSKKESLRKHIFMRTLNHNFQVRFVKNKLKTALSIFDGKEVMIIIKSLNAENFTAIWSNNENLIDLSQVYFNSLWKKWH